MMSGSGSPTGNRGKLSSVHYMLIFPVETLAGSSSGWTGWTAIFIILEKSSHGGQSLKKHHLGDVTWEFDLPTLDGFPEVYWWSEGLGLLLVGFDGGFSFRVSGAFEGLGAVANIVFASNVFIPSAHAQRNDHSCHMS